MANWAVIIGINDYWEAPRNLKGAVNDAMRMLEWLLNAIECHVPAENIFLLTRPRPANIPVGVNYRDAIADELLKLIPALGKISDEQDVDRLFFYFAGHGITNFEGGGDEQCLVMADFTPDLTNKALKFNAIKDFFKKTNFREQFFFIDACRNLLLWPYEFETGSTTIKRKGNIKQQTVDQFILNSTAPHSKAWEGLLKPTDKPGQERGAFTGALLDGLNGDGAAKIYDNNENEYLVKKEGLFDYVINKIDARNIFVVKDPVHPVKQLPRKDGEHSKDPLLVRIPFASVKPERLQLFVAPDEVWPIAELRIGDEIQVFQQVFAPPVKGVPLALPPLQPMKYTINASAPKHILEGKNPKRRSIAFYEPMEISVRFVPEPQLETPPSEVRPEIAPEVRPEIRPEIRPLPEVAPEVRPLPEVAPDAMRGFDEAPRDPTLIIGLESRGLDDYSYDPEIPESFTVTEPMPHMESTNLTIEADDPLASLEISNSTGTLLDLGHGQLQLSNLDAGFYHARVVAPEGEYVEEVVELELGDNETLHLEAPRTPPSRLMENINEKIGWLETTETHNRDESRMARRMSSVQPSTILALAAVAANRNAVWGSRLRNLEVTPFNKVGNSERPAGLQVIAGVESLRQQLSSVRVRLWPQEASISEEKNAMTVLPSIAEVAEHTAASKSGPHWLSMEVPGRTSAVFSLYLPPQMITLLIFYRDAEGHVRVFQYHLRMQSDHIAQPDDVRRCELIQRFSMSGRFKNGYELAKDQLDSESVDSVGCCMGGYLALLFEDKERLEKAVRKLKEICPDLSDTHVLAGAYHELAGHLDEASACYSSALDRGIPVFANGISRLHEGLDRTHVEHAHATLLTKVADSRLRGLLWSACSGPVELLAGRSFEEILLSLQAPDVDSAA